MASFEPDLLLLLIGLGATVLTFAIIAAVLYLWKMLRKEVRWPGLQNPYGWPADMLGDLDTHTVDKSVCKKRLRPSRLEKNAKKFHKTLADVLPEAEPPPVPVRVDSLTSADRRAFELDKRQVPKTSEKQAQTSVTSGQSSATKARQPAVEKKVRSPLEGLFPTTSNAATSDEHVKLRRERKRSSSGYRDERRRSPRNSFREHISAGSKLPQTHQQSIQRERPHEHTVEISEDNEPPPPYSEVRRYP